MRLPADASDFAIFPASAMATWEVIESGDVVVCRSRESQCLSVSAALEVWMCQVEVSSFCLRLLTPNFTFKFRAATRLDETDAENIKIL